MKDFIRTHKSKIIKAILALVGLLLIGLLWRGVRGEVYVSDKLSLLGLVDLRLYSLVVLAALIICTYLAYRLFGQLYPKLVKKVDPLSALLTILVPGLIGARIYHVLTDFHLYVDQPAQMLAIWDGGVGFIGGIIGGLLGVVFYARSQKISFEKILSVVVVVVPLGQAIGRLGNFFNQELYGLPTDLPWGQYIRLENRFLDMVSSAYYHPIFLYESIANLILAFILYSGLKRGVRGSKLTLVYIGMYGAIRFLLDFLRIEGRTGFWYLSYAQWLVLIGYLAAVVFGIGFNAWFRMKYGIWFTRHQQLVELGIVKDQNQ